MVIKGGCKQLMNVKEELSQLKKGKMWFTYSLLWFGKQLRCIIGCTGGGLQTTVVSNQKNNTVFYIHG